MGQLSLCDAAVTNTPQWLDRKYAGCAAVMCWRLWLVAPPYVSHPGTQNGDTAPFLEHGKGTVKVPTGGGKPSLVLAFLWPSPSGRVLLSEGGPGAQGAGRCTEPGCGGGGERPGAVILSTHHSGQSGRLPAEES